jgi:hypothetical protein
LYLSHILYGSVAHAQGELLLTARGGGERGLLATYNCSFAAVAQPTVAVQVTGQGEGSVVVQIPNGTTARQLIQALRQTPGFSLLFYSELTGDGMGSNPVTSVVSSGPVGGLLQYLISVLGIEEWANREQVTTGIVQALLWPASGKVLRQSPEPDGLDLMEGIVDLNIALQLNDGFHEQNALMDLVRRRVFQAVKRFQHPWLSGLGFASWNYSNVLKAKQAGVQTEDKAAEGAEMNVQFSLPIQWTEQALDPELAIFADLQSLQIGLFREPLTDPLGPGGGEFLDELITITQ